MPFKDEDNLGHGKAQRDADDERAKIIKQEKENQERREKEAEERRKQEEKRKK